MKTHQWILFYAIMFIIVFDFSACKNTSNNKNEANAQLKGNISISGAFALYPITVRWAEEFQKIHPKVRIDISAGGAGKGMTDALSGMADMGMFSREVSPEEEAKDAWKVALTRDAVLPTINAQNPFLSEVKLKGISRENFERIYVKEEISNWGKLLGNEKIEDKINLFTRSDACGAAAMWAEYIGTSQENLKGVGVFGDPGMADAIRNDKLGLGYNNIAYVYDISSRVKYNGIEVVPIDINNNGLIDPDEKVYDTLDDIVKAVAEGKYPAPPARDLYFVSKGRPQKDVVVQFIKWILTDGQQFVAEAGYVQLSEEKIKKELDKLN